MATIRVLRSEDFRLPAIRPDSEPDAGIRVMTEEIAGDSETEPSISTRDQNRTHGGSITAASKGVNFNTCDPEFRCEPFATPFKKMMEKRMEFNRH